MKVWQEFNCPRCEGFFRLRLNLSVNGPVYACCPECGRKHSRYIEDGVILERKRDDRALTAAGERAIEIIVPKSAYSKTSVLNRPRSNKESRESVALTESNTDGEAWRRQHMQERWAERFGAPQ